jgi:hypothetical protein
MADFCKQCSEATFGEDFGDMKGLSTEEDTRNDLFAMVLCERCGHTLVDHTGLCVSPHCVEKHGGVIS